MDDELLQYDKAVEQLREKEYPMLQGKLVRNLTLRSH